MLYIPPHTRIVYRDEHGTRRRAEVLSYTFVAQLLSCSMLYMVARTRRPVRDVLIRPSSVLKVCSSQK